MNDKFFGIRDCNVVEGICPKCGGSLQYGEIDVQSEHEITFDVECDTCDFSGLEWYHIEFFGVEDLSEYFSEDIGPGGCTGID